MGKNNRQNEYLTHRLASSSDTWLHTKDIPGSHVVIKSREFGEKTLLEAAMLAAYFSKAKHSSQVPVDYTRIKYVKKTNGAKPGFVIYENQKTVFVTPDEKLVETLRRKNNKKVYCKRIKTLQYTFFKPVHIHLQVSESIFLGILAHKGP